MSLVERYGRAAQSDDLALKVEISDLDYLIASGLVRESLATRLIRLRTEFDSINSDRRAMSLLRSMATTRFVLIAHAVSEATNRRRQINDERAAYVAVRFLEAYLDPNCPLCDGRGFTGGYGIPTIRCTACRETGKRQIFWKSEVEEAFARWLQSSVERKIAEALATIGAILRDPGFDRSRLKISRALQGYVVTEW